MTLDFPYPNNANIYWMAVIKSHHGRGVGTALLKKAQEYASCHGAKTITVETVAPSACDENYLKTYEFYNKNGFKPLFNLKPAGYEWDMVYMAKPCLGFPKSKIEDLEVHQLCEEDIALLVDGFARHKWDKPELLFKDYLKEQKAGTRQVWVAYLGKILAGYATLNLAFELSTVCYKGHS